MRQVLSLPLHCLGNCWLHRSSAGVASHHHDELELNFAIAGWADYLVGDRRYRLVRNSLLWLFPRQEHVLLHQSADHEMWILVFHPQVPQRLCRQPNSQTLLQGDPPGEFCRRIAEAGAAELAELFAQTASALTNPDLFNAALGHALLLAWREFGQAPEVAGTDVHPAVEKAARLLRTRSEAGTEPSLAAVARQSGLSPSHLARLFRAQTGVSLVEYRNRRRIEKFVEIYGTGKRENMSRAALQSGFGSYAQFFRVFHEVMGCTPAHWRRRLTPVP